MPSISALSQRWLCGGAAHHCERCRRAQSAAVPQQRLGHSSRVRRQVRPRCTASRRSPASARIASWCRLLDRFSKLTVSVFWQDERINNFEVTSNVHSWKTGALSGDSYVIIVRDKADTVRLFAYRANSQHVVHHRPARGRGLHRQGRRGRLTSLRCPTTTSPWPSSTRPTSRISTFHFKDAAEAARRRPAGQRSRSPRRSRAPTCSRSRTPPPAAC
jgi:hypothetical protein